jgi:hypothetical protein
MPGIADSPNSFQIQPSGNSISQDVNITPAVGDFMKAFREGFITTEDITKRAKDKPLEDAQRQQALQDTNTIRPKQRELASKQLDVQSSQADTLAQIQPLLSEAGIKQAQQQLENVRGHGNPEAIADLHRKYALPLLGKQVPYDSATGQLNTEEALNDVQKATELARAYQLRQFAMEHAKPQTTTTTDKTGRKTVTEQYVVPGTNAKLTEPRVAETTEPNQPEAVKSFRQGLESDSVLKPIKEAQTFLATAKGVLNTPPEKITNAEDQLLVESLIKLTDPAGVIRQSKVEYLNEMTPVWQTAIKRLAHLTSNQNTVLSPQDRSQIARAVNRLEEGYGKAAQPRLQLFAKQAAEQNLTPDQIFDTEELGMLNKQHAIPSAVPVATPAAGEIPTVTHPDEAPPTAKFFKSPDGRTFINPKYTGSTP